MSSDNGIYVLNLKDQSRVIHAQAIDNLWWSFISFDSDSETLVPTRLIQYFGGAPLQTKSAAKRKAFAMADDYPMLEYGISSFDVDETWNELVAKAKELAILEIMSIKNRPDEEWKRKSSWYADEIKSLQDILEM
jgi:hypothetical protein